MTDPGPNVMDLGEAFAEQDLRATLRAIAKLDPSNPAHGSEASYDTRNPLIYQAVALALTAGYTAGVAPGSEPAWPVAYIDLPVGQVSWHLPEYPRIWDGHTTEEKYARIDRYGTDLMAPEDLFGS